MKREYFLLLILGIVVLIASMILFTYNYRTKPDQTKTQFSTVDNSAVNQTTTTQPQTPKEEKFGVIYKSYNNPYYSEAHKIALYDFSSDQSNIIKEKNQDFASSENFKNWVQYDSKPLVLIDYFNLSSNSNGISMGIDLFTADMPKEKQVFISKSSIVSDVSSVTFSPDHKKVAYCGTEGQYTIQDLWTGEKKDFTNTNICQVAYQGDVLFSKDSFAIYYQNIQISDNSKATAIPPITYKKIDISTGKIYDVGNLVTMPFFNSDQTEYMDRHMDKIIIRKVGQFEKTDNSSNANLPIVSVIRLPNDKQSRFENEIFTLDGKGVFYSTISQSGQRSIGYFDLNENKHYFPLPVPDLKIWALQFFGALDRNSLVYGVWETGVYYGVESQSNNMDLYRQSVSGGPKLIDRANYFDLLSFVKSK